MERTPQTSVGLFAGIGGIELGFRDAGIETEMLCEIMPEARRVLESRFPGIGIERDVRQLASLDGAELNRAFPAVDIVTAGFPCQDLSQAGRTRGISGENSGLVTCLLELLDKRNDSPRWVLIENVPFMLQLDRGRAMNFLTESLEGLGFRWAYRVVDTRSFGLPHRRRRVIMLASRTEDPRDVLFADDAEQIQRPQVPNKTLCGFYWTEGTRGLGWAVDAVPTLKGGSTVGIPSPPGVWRPAVDRFETPEIRAAERLQGFPDDWTLPAVDDPSRRNGPRWKLVGNAVTVDLARWVGRRLLDPGRFEPSLAKPGLEDRWPIAAYGEPVGKVWTIDVGMFPLAERYQPLNQILGCDTRQLSDRAARGFHRRFSQSSLNKPDGFLESLETYLSLSEVMNGAAVSA